ncbi:MAG: hypothetical protein Q8P95_03575 [bacterium]|nr:hypothetical protein [bacterium]
MSSGPSSAPGSRPPEYMSFEDVLSELRIDEEELKKLVSQGELRGFRDGLSMKFNADDVRRLADEPRLVEADDGIINFDDEVPDFELDDDELSLWNSDSGDSLPRPPIPASPVVSSAPASDASPRSSDGALEPDEVARIKKEAEKNFNDRLTALLEEHRGATKIPYAEVSRALGITSPGIRGRIGAHIGKNPLRVHAKELGLILTKTAGDEVSVGMLRDLTLDKLTSVGIEFKRPLLEVEKKAGTLMALIKFIGRYPWIFNNNPWIQKVVILLTLSGLPVGGNSAYNHFWPEGPTGDTPSAADAPAEGASEGAAAVDANSASSVPVTSATGVQAPPPAGDEEAPAEEGAASVAPESVAEPEPAPPAQQPAEPQPAPEPASDGQPVVTQAEQALQQAIQQGKRPGESQSQFRNRLRELREAAADAKRAAAAEAATPPQDGTNNLEKAKTVALDAITDANFGTNRSKCASVLRDTLKVAQEAGVTLDSKKISTQALGKALTAKLHGIAAPTAEQLKEAALAVAKDILGDN